MSGRKSLLQTAVDFLAALSPWRSKNEEVEEVIDIRKQPKDDVAPKKLDKVFKQETDEKKVQELWNNYKETRLGEKNSTIKSDAEDEITEVDKGEADPARVEDEEVVVDDVEEGEQEEEHIPAAAISVSSVPQTNSKPDRKGAGVQFKPRSPEEGGPVQRRGANKRPATGGSSAVSAAKTKKKPPSPAAGKDKPASPAPKTKKEKEIEPEDTKKKQAKSQVSRKEEEVEPLDTKKKPRKRQLSKKEEAIEEEKDSEIGSQNTKKKQPKSKKSKKAEEVEPEDTKKEAVEEEKDSGSKKQKVQQPQSSKRQKSQEANVLDEIENLDDGAPTTLLSLPEPLEDCKVAQLKAVLKSHDMVVSGKKDILIQRLRNQNYQILWLSGSITELPKGVEVMENMLQRKDEFLRLKEEGKLSEVCPIESSMVQDSQPLENNKTKKQSTKADLQALQPKDNKKKRKDKTKADTDPMEIDEASPKNKRQQKKESDSNEEKPTTTSKKRIRNVKVKLEAMRRSRRSSTANKKGFYNESRMSDVVWAGKGSKKDPIILER